MRCLTNLTSDAGWLDQQASSEKLPVTIKPEINFVKQCVFVRFLLRLLS